MLNSTRAVGAFMNSDFEIEDASPAPDVARWPTRRGVIVRVLIVWAAASLLMGLFAATSRSCSTDSNLGGYIGESAEEWERRTSGPGYTCGPRSIDPRLAALFAGSFFVAPSVVVLPLYLLVGVIRDRLRPPRQQDTLEDVLADAPAT